MKYLFAVLLLISFKFTQAQSLSDDIYGTWVVQKITYKDGTELSNDNALKYTYLKYTFSNPDKFSAALTYAETGTERTFEINGDNLQLKSIEGTVVNTQKIIGLGNTLLLLQAGHEGYDDPSSLLYYFVRENKFQSLIPFAPNDIHSIHGVDTVYNASPKIYASYNGPSFQQYVYKGIADHIEMTGRSQHFVAAFTVNKTGVADSVVIIEGVDDQFNKRFLKVFNQARKDWRPAMLKGNSVNVRMSVDLRYSTSATTIPAYFAAQKGLVAYNNKDYEVAEYYYDKAIETEPKDKEFLFRRGMCRMLLGNRFSACEDWNAAKNLGSNATIDAVLDKYCK